MKKVFELALSGRNTTQIAYGMNELQFPTPGLYAKRKNLLMGSNPIIAPDSEMLWNAAIVWRILRRYEYTGALVMGRRKKIDVNTTSIRTLPEDKWIIAENAHEAIVTKDEYYQAQKAIRNVTPIQYKVGDDFALKGKICCGNCKRQLRHEKQYGEMVFCCGYKRAAGKFSKCYGGYYREYQENVEILLPPVRAVRLRYRSRRIVEVIPRYCSKETHFLCPAGGSFIDRVIVDGMHLLHASGHAGPKSYRSSWEGPALSFFGAGGAS